MTRRVIVTRPREQAGEWVARLQAAGFDAVALPLIEIAAPADGAPLDDAWAQLDAQDLVMFVSPNAAAHFLARRPPGSAPWPAGTLAAAPGPGTARVLAQAGVPMTQIVTPASDAEQFDSESLWEQLRLRPWQGRRALFVRGESGRDWLADRLRDAGAAVAHVTAYRRVPPQLDADGRALLTAARAQPQAHCWWFSSGEALAHLASLCPPGADWSAARAVATHPRIAERAVALGFGRVDLASPAPEAVLAVLAAAADATDLA